MSDIAAILTALRNLVRLLPSTLTIQVDTGWLVFALVAFAIWCWRS